MVGAGRVDQFDSPKAWRKRIQGKTLFGRAIRSQVSWRVNLRNQSFTYFIIPNRTLDEKFDLNVPEYPGYEQIVDITQDSGHRLKL